MGDKIAAIMGTLAIAVVITSLVLPGRQSPQLASALGNAYASAAKASEGR